MESNNHIDKLFKGGLKNFESGPANEIWSRIEASLNSDETLPIRNKYTQYAAALFLFLSLCLISVPFTKKSNLSTATAGFDIPILKSESVKHDISDNETLYQASASELSDEIPASAERRSARESIAFTAEKMMSPIEAVAIRSHEEDFIFVPAENVSKIESRHTGIQFSREFNKDIPLNALSAERIDDSEDYIVTEREVGDNHLDIDLQGMYIGVNGSYNQTSLLEYGNIYRGERPIQPSLKFGTAKGITVGYNFNNHFGLQIDYIYNAILGQNYVSSQEEVVTEKTLALNYDQLVLTTKFKQARFSDLTEHPIVVNYSAGIQYGQLRDYRVPQEKRWESTEDLFSDHDWALVMGLDYDIYVDDQLFVSLGGRATIGTDISLHNEPLDDYAKRNFVFGIRGGLNYVFR